MRKVIIPISVIILIISLSGCSILYIQGMKNNAENAVKHADAQNIAKAINDYNTLNPDNVLPDDVTLEEAKEILGEWVWPRGLSEDSERAAWKLIVIKDGVADLTSEAKKMW